MNKDVTEKQTQGYGPRFRVFCIVTNAGKIPIRPMTKVTEPAMCPRLLRYAAKCIRDEAYHACRFASSPDNPGFIDDQIGNARAIG